MEIDACSHFLSTITVHSSLCSTQRLKWSYTADLKAGGVSSLTSHVKTAHCVWITQSLQHVEANVLMRLIQNQAQLTIVYVTKYKWFASVMYVHMKLKLKKKARPVIISRCIGWWACTCSILNNCKNLCSGRDNATNCNDNEHMPIPWSWRWILGSRVCFQSLRQPDRFSVGHYGLLLSTEVPPRHPVNTVNDKIMPSYKVGQHWCRKGFWFCQDENCSTWLYIASAFNTCGLKSLKHNLPGAWIKINDGLASTISW